MSKEIYNPLPIPKKIPAGYTIWSYALGNYDTPWLDVYYNGAWERLPMGAVESVKQVTTTVVNAGRNAMAGVIGEQIGRTQSKIDAYKIPFLYAHEWSRINKIFKDQIVRTVRYFDQEAGKFILRDMYVSDRTATPFAFKQDGSGEVEIFKDCELHLIDMGRQTTIATKYNPSKSPVQPKPQHSPQPSQSSEPQHSPT